MARCSSASRMPTCWFARMQAVQGTMIRRLHGLDELIEHVDLLDPCVSWSQL